MKYRTMIHILYLFELLSDSVGRYVNVHYYSFLRVYF
jgi:hypothetical protein